MLYMSERTRCNQKKKEKKDKTFIETTCSSPAATASAPFRQSRGQSQKPAAFPFPCAFREARKSVCQAMCEKAAIRSPSVSKDGFRTIVFTKEKDKCLDVELSISHRESNRSSLNCNVPIGIANNSGPQFLISGFCKQSSERRFNLKKLWDHKRKLIRKATRVNLIAASCSEWSPRFDLRKLGDGSHLAHARCLHFRRLVFRRHGRIAGRGSALQHNFALPRRDFNLTFDGSLSKR